MLSSWAISTPTSQLLSYPSLIRLFALLSQSLSARLSSYQINLPRSNQRSHALSSRLAQSSRLAWTSRSSLALGLAPALGLARTSQRSLSDRASSSRQVKDAKSQMAVLRSEWFLLALESAVRLRSRPLATMRRYELNWQSKSAKLKSN